MKAIGTLALIIAIAATFQSCQKSSNNTTTGTADSSFMKATISGLPFSASGPSSAYATTSNSGGISYLYINGSATTGKAVQITLINVVAPGSISFPNPSASAYYFSSGGFLGPSTYASSGSVTISTLSPLITGTFNFTTTDNISVFNGSFSIPAP